MFFKKIFFIVSLCSATLFAQSNIGMNLNAEDVELHATWDTTMLTDDLLATHYLLFASYLHTDNDNLIQAGIFAKNSFQGRQDIFLSFGMIGVAADDFVALVPTAKADFYLTNIDLPPSYISIEASYAPSPLCFSDAQSYMDAKAEFDMEIIPNILLYGGYRYIHTEYTYKDKTFNSSLFGGMKITF